MPVRLMHVLGHPRLPMDTESFPEDAQVWTCRRFCDLLSYLKIPFLYYGVRGSKVPEGGELVPCRKLRNSWHFRNQAHYDYNGRLSALLEKHVGKGDGELIASLYGAPQADIADKGLKVIEPMVGYDHCWTHYRVFPSYAQQNVIYATWSSLTWEDRCNDAVIPHFANPEEFHLSPHPGEYLLYLGRDGLGKGNDIAREVARLAGLPLREEHSGWSGQAKANLIADARAVLVPTRYVEPFGYVVIEALLSGTPVITSDWGSFPELVINGFNGFRCRRIDDYLRAVQDVTTLDRKAIRADAVARFSLEAVAPKYLSYFEAVLNNRQ